MITGRNILAIASNWRFDPTSKHHVMKILSEHNCVLWVNYHGSRRPRVSSSDIRGAVGKLHHISQGPEWVSDTMLVLTPLVLPLPGSAWARRVNQRLVVHQIRRALQRLPRRPVQLWSFAPDVDYLVGRFQEELDLYYCVDEFSAFSRYDAPAIERLERQQIDKCDLVITTSSELQQSKGAHHPHTYLVTHGVSYEHFARATDDNVGIPESMLRVRRPIFGFFGLIQDWVNVEWIAELARRHREWSFVLIGRSQTNIDACRAHPNIHLPGPVPFEALPGYCRAFDVGLIPFRVNRLTRHVNPIKLREYLAAGLPVVSSDLPEVRRYRPHVFIGQTLDGFEQACAQALQARSAYHQRLRQAAVEEESWRAKVEELCGIVERVQTEWSGAGLH